MAIAGRGGDVHPDTGGTLPPPLAWRPRMPATLGKPLDMGGGSTPPVSIAKSLGGRNRALKRTTAQAPLTVYFLWEHGPCALRS